MKNTIIENVLRKNRRDSNIFNTVVIGIALLALLLYSIFNKESNLFPPKTDPDTKTASKIDYPFPEIEKCAVKRCIDGDTLVVETSRGEERVRMIGSDTPETVKKDTPVEKFGPEATEYTKHRIQKAGGSVYLKADGDPRDKYGRRLALVYLDTEGKYLLNEELIRMGLARARLQYNYSDTIKNRFYQAQESAKEEKLGVWSLE
ncbi:MAG: thermonuclease family protein [Planctomycetia bacterium]|nr:thermonuclease family protein [Planctomycetia bacterium]